MYNSFRVKNFRMRVAIRKLFNGHKLIFPNYDISVSVYRMFVVQVIRIGCNTILPAHHLQLGSCMGSGYVYYSCISCQCPWWSRENGYTWAIYTQRLNILLYCLNIIFINIPNSAGHGSLGRSVRYCSRDRSRECAVWLPWWALWVPLLDTSRCQSRGRGKMVVCIV